MREGKMNKKMIFIVTTITGLAWLLSSCAGAPANPITSEPTNTPIPSPTPVPPTETAIPPTKTAVPSATPPPVDPKLLSDIEEMIANEGQADPEVIDSIVKRVGEDPSAVVASILPKLSAGNLSESTQVVYAWVLGLAQDPAGIDPLVVLVKDSNSNWVKRNCFYSLGSIGGEKASEGMISILDDTTDKELRYEMLNVLASMQYESALPLMGEILEVDPNQEFWKPIFIFGKMGDLGVPYLLDKINDDDVNVRANSISQLGQLLIAPEAAQPLREHYWVEEDLGIRGLILSSLEMIAPDLETMQRFSEEVINKEKDPDLVNYAQETIDSLPDMRTRIDSFISEKNISAVDFKAAYKALYDNYGHGEKESLASASTLADEAQLKKLRERILQRDSDEALYDYFEVNEIIRLNRLAQAVAEQEGKPWEAEPTAPPPVGSRYLPNPSQEISGVWLQDIIFSPDGKLIANNGLDGVEIYDATTYEYKHTLEGYYSDLAFSPNGKQLAVSHTTEGEVWLSLWDLGAPEVKNILSRESDAFFSNFILYNPDDHILAWGIGSELLLLDTVSEKLLNDQPNLLELQTQSAIFSPDGKTLVICCSQSSIVLWDMQENKVAGEIEDAGPVDAFVIAAGESLLIGFDRETRKIHQWDLESLRSDKTSIDLVEIDNTYLGDFSFSPDGLLWAVSCSNEELNPRNILVVYDVMSGELLGSIECYLQCSSVAFNPNGNNLTVTTPGNVLTWKMNSLSK